MEEKGDSLLHHFSKSIERIQLWISSPSPFSYQMEHSLLFLSFTYIITNRDVEKEDGGIVCLFWAQLLGKLSWQVLNTPSSAVGIEIIGIFFHLKGGKN